MSGYRDNAYEAPKKLSILFRVIRWLADRSEPFWLSSFILAFISACMIGAYRDRLEDKRKEPERQRLLAEHNKMVAEHEFYCGGFGHVQLKDLPAECVGFWESKK